MGWCSIFTLLLQDAAAITSVYLVYGKGVIGRGMNIVGVEVNVDVEVGVEVNVGVLVAVLIGGGVKVSVCVAEGIGVNVCVAGVEGVELDVFVDVGRRVVVGARVGAGVNVGATVTVGVPGMAVTLVDTGVVDNQGSSKPKVNAQHCERVKVSTAISINVRDIKNLLSSRSRNAELLG